MIQPIKGELNLAEIDTILVKFFFTNDKHIPSGVPNLQHPGNEERDAIHASQEKYFGKDGDKSLGAVGRHREDRVDTGEPVIKDLPGTRAGLLQGDLVKAGYTLVGFRWWKQAPKPKPGERPRTPKFVVQAAYVKGAPYVAHPPHITSTMSSLATDAVWFCHVWKNPNGVATINFVGRQPDGKMENGLVVAGGKFIMAMAA